MRTEAKNDYIEKSPKRASSKEVQRKRRGEKSVRRKRKEFNWMTGFREAPGSRNNTKQSSQLLCHDHPSRHAVEGKRKEKRQAVVCSQCLLSPDSTPPSEGNPRRFVLARLTLRSLTLAQKERVRFVSGELLSSSLKERRRLG